MVIVLGSEARLIGFESQLHILTNHVNLGKLPNLPVPQIPYLYNGTNNGTNLMELLWEFSEFLYVKPLEQNLAYRKSAQQILAQQMLFLLLMLSPFSSGSAV